MDRRLYPSSPSPPLSYLPLPPFPFKDPFYKVETRDTQVPGVVTSETNGWVVTSETNGWSPLWINRGVSGRDCLVLPETDSRRRPDPPGYVHGPY